MVNDENGISITDYCPCGSYDYNLFPQGCMDKNPQCELHDRSNKWLKERGLRNNV